MKKLISVGLALMLSLALGGLSVAENGLKTKNLIAAADSGIIQANHAFMESIEWSDGLLLSQLDCGQYGVDLCKWIESICCDSSPVEPQGSFCNKNWTNGACGQCYHPCD